MIRWISPDFTAAFTNSLSRSSVSAWAAMITTSAWSGFQRKYQYAPTPIAATTAITSSRLTFGSSGSLKSAISAARRKKREPAHGQGIRPRVVDDQLELVVVAA